MGAIVEGVGDLGYEHEGYTARLVDSSGEDRSWIAVSQAACSCGWRGEGRYREAMPDCDAEEAALTEWERVHLAPLVLASHANRADRLHAAVATAAARALSDIDGFDHRRAALERLGELVADGVALVEQQRHTHEMGWR